MKLHLQEVDQTELNKIIEEQYLQKISYKKWNNMGVIEFLSSNYLFIDLDSTAKALDVCLCNAWNIKANDPKLKNSIKSRCTLLKTLINDVIKSNAAKQVILKNISQQTKETLKTNIQINAINELVEETQGGESSTTAAKRRKQITKKEFEEMALSFKLKTLIEKYGKDNIIDLSKEKLIPKKFERSVNNIVKELDLNFAYYLKKNEMKLLRKISQATNSSELLTAIKSISILDDSNELCYISLAVQKLCLVWKTKQLENSQHNEDWYRINVYGDLYDNIFLMQAGWATKRSECHSLLWKKMKEASDKNIRLDFIISLNSNDGMIEGFFSEDKPFNEMSKSDKEKADFLRKKMLEYWGSLFPYSECIKYLECLSCHFNGLTLTIKTTKIIDEYAVHYLKKQLTIPNQDSTNSKLACYLSTVISLFRAIKNNLQKAQIMLDIIYDDDLEFTTTTESTITYLESGDFEESFDSFISTSSSSSSSSSKWQNIERKNRILKKIETAMSVFEESGEYVGDSWEEHAFLDNV